MRARLPDPNLYFATGWERLRIRLAFWRPVFRLRAYLKAVVHADHLNHLAHSVHIHELDGITNYLGENIKPSMRAEDLVRFAREVQAAYTTHDADYPWEGYD